MGWGIRPRQSQSHCLFTRVIRSIATQGLVPPRVWYHPGIGATHRLVQVHCVLWMNTFIPLYVIKPLNNSKKKVIILGCQHRKGIFKFLFLEWGSLHHNGHMNIWGQFVGVSSLYCVGVVGRTQVFRPTGKRLNLLCPLASPEMSFWGITIPNGWIYSKTDQLGLER